MTNEQLVWVIRRHVANLREANAAALMMIESRPERDRERYLTIIKLNSMCAVFLDEVAEAARATGGTTIEQVIDRAESAYPGSLPRQSGGPSMN